MNCPEARRAMAERLAGETDEIAIRELAVHVASCPACAREEGAVDEALAALSEDDVPDPGPVYWSSFGKRVRARIKDRARRSRRRTALLSAAAAALVAVLALQTARVQRNADDGGNARGAIASIEAPRDEVQRLREILERASTAEEGRAALRLVLDDLGPGDPLELDEALETLTQEESATLERDLAGLEG